MATPTMLPTDEPTDEPIDGGQGEIVDNDSETVEDLQENASVKRLTDEDEVTTNASKPRTGKADNGGRQPYSTDTLPQKAYRPPTAGPAASDVGNLKETPSNYAPSGSRTSVSRSPYGADATTPTFRPDSQSQDDEDDLYKDEAGNGQPSGYRSVEPTEESEPEEVPRQPKEAGKPGNDGRLSVQRRPEDEPGFAESEPLSRGDLQDREASGGSGGRDSKKTKGEDKKASGQSTDGTSKQASADNKEQQSLYNKAASGDNPNGWQSRLRGLAKGRRGKIIGGGGIAAVITGLILGFVFLLPLKLIHVVTNLEDHFFAVAQNAISDETNTLFSAYVKHAVVPSLLSCSHRDGKLYTTIDKNCTVGVEGDTLVKRLWRGWAQGRLENKLATNDGIEFAADARTKRVYMKFPGSGNNVEVTNWTSGNETLDRFIANNKEFENFDRQGLRRTIKESLRENTYFDRTYKKIKIAYLLRQKYGIRMCVISCKLSDRYDDWKDKKSLAYKMLFSRKVLEPRSEFLGVLTQCVLSASCNPTDADGKPKITPEDIAANYNEPRSDTDRDLTTRLFALGFEKGLSPEEITDIFEKYRQSGFKGYIAREIVTKLVEEATGNTDGAKKAGDIAEKFAGARIPYIGEVYLAAQLFQSADNAGPTIRKYTYMTNAASMVAAFAMYRTFADETKSGHTDAKIAGSFSDSMSAGSQCPDNKGLSKDNVCANGDKQLGGTAEAEEAPLYTALLNSSANSTGLLSSILSANASAAGSPSNILCANNKPIPAGQLICSEESLIQGNPLDGVHKFFNDHPIFKLAVAVAKLITGLMQQILNTVCKVGICGAVQSLLSQITNAIMGLPGIRQLLDTIVQLFKDYILPPDPVALAQSGARSFDMMAGGADVLANDFAHFGLGGKLLSPVKAVTIRDQYLDQEKQYRQSQESVAGRLFDESNPDSAVSRIAMSMPSDMSKLGSGGLADMLIGSYHKLGSLFTSPLNFAHAGAAAAVDPFGTSQYGYDPSDPVFQQDPEELEASCQDGTRSLAWSQAAADNLDPNTYQPMSENTNPCLLLTASIGAAGGAFTTDVLTPEEAAAAGLGGSSSSSGGSSGGSTGAITDYANPLRGVKNLGAERIDEGVDYVGSGPVYALGDGIITSLKCAWFCAYGNSVVYKLTNGPASGKSVFVSEHCAPNPALVVGGTVHKDTVLCTMDPRSIETGWANGDGTDRPAASDIYHESDATAYGRNFSDLMVKLGAPGGTYDHPEQKDHETGSLPAKWPGVPTW